ncbi:MAG: hypothetical protein GXO25_02270 [Euryarchaeota archaeon]|nr:hypothetical protein [Euryarchaeota archaeon]
MKIKFAIIYSATLAAMTVFFGIWNILKYVGVNYTPLLSVIAVIGLFPVIYLKSDLPAQIFAGVCTVFGAGIILLAPLFISVSGNLMNSFILFLVAALILNSIRDSLLRLYSGLSFYIVGIFILLAFSGIEITILLASIADHYINCIGTQCSQPVITITPGMILLLLTIPATYPYFRRDKFRRDIHDKEGS